MPAICRTKSSNLPDVPPFSPEGRLIATAALSRCATISLCLHGQAGAEKSRSAAARWQRLLGGGI
jgi:hypothetical protein